MANTQLRIKAVFTEDGECVKVEKKVLGAQDNETVDRKYDIIEELLMSQEEVIVVEEDLSDESIVEQDVVSDEPKSPDIGHLEVKEVIIKDEIPSHGNTDQGVLFGPWVQPYGYYGNDGTWPVLGNFNWMHMHRSRMDTGDDYDVLNILKNFEKSGMRRLSLQLGEQAGYSGGGKNPYHFNESQYYKQIDKFANHPEVGPLLTKLIDAGRVEIYLIDEPNWRGHWANPLSNQLIDNLGKHVKSIWPNAITIVRAPIRQLESGGRGVHIWEHVDRAPVTIEANRWMIRKGKSSKYHNVEWMWAKEYEAYNGKGTLKPRVMCQGIRGPRYTTQRFRNPITGLYEQGKDKFDWARETGADETDVWNKRAVANGNPRYLSFNELPDHLDWLVVSACLPRNPKTGELDLENGVVIPDCVGFFRWDRFGGATSDRGNGSGQIVGPFSDPDNSVLRDTMFELRDKLNIPLDQYHTLKTRNGLQPVGGIL